jgi:Tat protein secretion system quality control protein TatD with DNase activity
VNRYIKPQVPTKVFFSLSSVINLSNDGALAKVGDIIRSIPDDRILIESDLHTAGDDMDAVLEEMYRKVCEVKGWSLRQGVGILGKNFQDFIST